MPISYLLDIIADRWCSFLARLPVLEGRLRNGVAKGVSALAPFRRIVAKGASSVCTQQVNVRRLCDRPLSQNTNVSLSRLASCVLVRVTVVPWSAKTTPVPCWVMWARTASASR